MNHERLPRVYFFAGPTLSAAEIYEMCGSARADVQVLPPVQQGDLLRLPNEPPDIIGIIDGYFFQVPAVLHKEILFVMEHGAQVLGAASLGALRAAELDVFGMEGIGEIYRWYKEGLVDGDDEVAVVHASEQEGFRQVTEALVNIRHNLARAQQRGLVSLPAVAAILARAKAVDFTQRRYEYILQLADGDLSPTGIEALRHFLRDEAVDLKRADARALVRTVVNRLNGEQASPSHIPVPVHRTIFFHLYQREYVGQSAGNQHIADTRVVAFQKLLSPSFPRLYQRVALRSLAVDEALTRGLSAGDLARLLVSFRQQHELHSDAAYEGWLRQHHMTGVELVEVLRGRALEAALLAHFQALHPTARGGAALFGHIVAAVQERTGLEVRQLLRPVLMQPGVPWEAPVLRELKFRERFAGALELAQWVLQAHAALARQVPGLTLALAPERLAYHFADRWGVALEDFNKALADHGFTSYSEFVETARLAYAYTRFGSA